MDVLHSPKRRQSEMKLAVGPAWSNGDDLVFTNELWHHLKHDLIYRHLKRIFAKMNTPTLLFHDLRHSYAVFSIQAGDDIKTVQENMGYYSTAFTLDVYGHVTDRMRGNSSERMDRYIHELKDAT